MTLPVQISFGPHALELQAYVSIVIDIIFVLDVLINFRTTILN